MQQEQLTQQIGIYHTLFLVCLVLFILFLLLDIFLFIRLEILKVIGFLTGKTERNAVRQMLNGELPEEQSSRKKKGRHKKGSKERNVKKMIMTPSGQLKMPDGTGVMLPTGGDITDVLGGDRVTDDVAHLAPSGTEIHQPEKKDHTKHRFVVEKEILFVHTDERIH